MYNPYTYNCPCYISSFDTLLSRGYKDVRNEMIWNVVVLVVKLENCYRCTYIFI